MTTTVDTNPERDRAMQIVRDALDLPEPQRSQFVGSACGDDESLLAEVREMLAAADSPTAPGRPFARDAEAVGGTIGPYRILEQLGEGGMGAVYKAEQRSPIKRTVAVKVIKLGFGTKEVIARFESERQALARMDHPNIAKVLDAGVTGTGRPYFVMEYVPGVPITQFADDKKLTVKQRLELFIPVCEAIAHAHTKAILHRDIKPMNVLAFLHDGKPTAKVIDFGIAKALTGDKLTDQTFNTVRGHVIGTYDSMSPEQADGSPDIDTRTDVYSLGVLLYELLTGLKPFDSATLRSAGENEIKRIIREVDPPRPSTRLMSSPDHATRAAAAQRADATALARELRSELEWIPLKAMRKERDRRYSSPSQLAEDIRNYLDGKPLIAGPESRLYRTQKLIGRYKISIATTVAMAILVITGVSLYIRGIRAEQRRTEAALKRAEEQTAIAETVSQFQSDMLSSADPSKLLGDKVTVLQATQSAINELDAGKLRDQPLVEAVVRETIGRTLRAISKFEDAERVLRAAVDIRRRALPADHPDLATSLISLSYTIQEQGRLAEAEPLLREALAINRRSLPQNHPDLVDSIGMLAKGLRVLGKLDEAEPLFREALEINRTTLPPDDPGIAWALHNLAQLLHAQDKLVDAEAAYREALRIVQKNVPAHHPYIAVNQGNLGSVLIDQGRLTEAEPLLREVLATRRKVLPARHKDTALALANLGQLVESLGKFDEAEELYREGLSIYREVLPVGHPFTTSTLNRLARLLESTGRVSEAEPIFEEMYRLAAASNVWPADAAIWMSGYGPCLVKVGKYEQAMEPLSVAYERLKSAGMEEGKRMRDVVAALVESCEHTNRPDDAAKWRAELEALQRATQPTTTPTTMPAR